MARSRRQPKKELLHQGATLAGGHQGQPRTNLSCVRGRGVLTPFTGWSLSAGDAQTLSLGGRLALEKGLRLELVGMRRENDVAPPEHQVQLRGALRW